MNVPEKAWDQMNMYMHHRLASSRTDIYANIETACPVL
jgi:hypothetical protein